MREIKVRAYDQEAGLMIYSDQEYDNYFFEFKDGKLRAFVIKEDVGTLHEPPEPYCEELDNLMETICLNDKNDKEIYEEDIVRIIEDRGDNIYSDLFNLDHTVEYREGCFYPICEEPSEDFEIIGNKYENPELLEDKNES